MHSSSPDMFLDACGTGFKRSSSCSSGVDSLEDAININVYKNTKKNNYFICVRDFIAVGGGFVLEFFYYCV
jgi:hypothetical protein